MGVPRSQAALSLRAAVAVVAVPVLLSVGACGGASAAGPSAPASATATRGGPPDFELESLSGDTVRLGDHLGREVVLIDFWATYCEPCLASMPHLDGLYEKYKGRGFIVLGVSIDGPETVAQVRAEVQKLGVHFPILLDQETRVVSLYNPKTSAPYSVLVGRDGSIRAKREGYTTSGGAALESDIVAALDAQAP